jgi:hypothetical protein
MFVWVFQGNLGEGKTNAMSIFSWFYKAKAARAGIQTALYANYGLKGSRRLDHYSHFYDVAQEDSSIILLDEAHTSLDSRLFQKGSNIYMTQFMFYLRKLRASLFMTTPHIKNLDSRIRALTNILVDCHKLPSGFKYDIYDFQGEKLLKSKFIPRYAAERIWNVGLYDTGQILTSVEFPANERDFKKFLNKIIEINDTARGEILARKQA